MVCYLEFPQEGRRGWYALKRLTVDQFLDLLELRWKSLLALTSSVFMRRIRRLVLEKIYSKPDYQEKVIANFIYELTPGKQSRFDKLPDVEPPSGELQKILDDACKMPTTLWFDNSKQLFELVVAGQTTICFKLMDYVASTYGTVIENYPPEVRSFWWALVDNWQQLNKDPDELLNGLLSGK